MIYLKLFENFNQVKIASDLTDELYKITDELYFNKVAIVQASVKVSESGELYITLLKLTSMNDRPGSGKLGMSALVKFADENNLPIKLIASSYMGSDLDRLTRFYEDFGFKVIEEFKLQDSLPCRKMIRKKKEDK